MSRPADNSVRTARIDGPLATAYLKTVKAKGSRKLKAGFTKAEEEMVNRGWKPTETAVVVTSFKQPERGGLFPAQSASDGSITIAWSSWDDGDNSTWEGQVYVSTSNGDVGIWVQQLNLTGSAPDPLSTAKVYYDSPAIYEASAPRALPRMGLLNVKNPQGGIRRVQDRWTLFQDPDFRSFYGCAAGRCAVSGLTCWAFAGPAAPACFISGCTASMLLCSYGTLWRV